jgi:hypothetical protein
MPDSLLRKPMDFQGGSKMKAILCKSGFYVVFKCHKHGEHLVEAARWHFNGNLDKPTISPSVRHFVPQVGSTPENTICHYSIADGEITYHGDNPHEFAGKKLDLLEFSPEDFETYSGEGYR